MKISIHPIPKFCEWCRLILGLYNCFSSCAELIIFACKNGKSKLNRGSCCRICVCSAKFGITKSVPPPKSTWFSVSRNKLLLECIIPCDQSSRQKRIAWCELLVRVSRYLPYRFKSYILENKTEREPYRRGAIRTSSIFGIIPKEKAEIFSHKLRRRVFLWKQNVLEGSTTLNPFLNWLLGQIRNRNHCHLQRISLSDILTPS